MTCIDGWNVVRREPGARYILDVDVDKIALNGFGLNLIVLKVVEFHDVEVIAAHVDRKVLAPVVLDSFELDPLADGKATNFVGSRAQRWIHRGL